MQQARTASNGERFKYQRHQPEQTLLYQLVERHYDEFQSLLAVQGTPLPPYVQTEFEEFLKCGRLEHGFLRVQCERCHHERLVALAARNAVFVQVVVPDEWQTMQYCLLITSYQWLICVNG